MLSHHFGSREGLFVAVVDAVEAGERVQTLDDHAHADPAAAVRASWRRLSQPSMAGRERLFFECYARGLQGEEPFASMVAGAVTNWVHATAAIEERRGVPRRHARARARASLALFRGLLLDLLATGDRRGVDDALEAFMSLLTAGGAEDARPR